jgi:hypothetical protein
MKHRCLLLASCAAVFVTSCAPRAAPRISLEGNRSVHITDVAGGLPLDTRPDVLPVEHVFELSNPGTEPVAIVSHKTRIDTTWHFVDLQRSLPRTIESGQTVGVAVTAKVRRQPGPQQFYVKLQFSNGDEVRLDMVVDG